MTEHDIQSEFIQWLSKHPDPRTGMIFAIPNGGKRSPRVGAELRREGVRPGVPDLFLPVPLNKYHGLFIELKTEKGVLSKQQEIWKDSLREQGYKVEICRGLESAQKAINNYLT